MQTGSGRATCVNVLNHSSHWVAKTRRFTMRSCSRESLFTVVGSISHGEQLIGREVGFLLWTRESQGAAQSVKLKGVYNDFHWLTDTELVGGFILLKFPQFSLFSLSKYT